MFGNRLTGFLGTSGSGGGGGSQNLQQTCNLGNTTTTDIVFNGVPIGADSSPTNNLIKFGIDAALGNAMNFLVAIGNNAANNSGNAGTHNVALGNSAFSGGSGGNNNFAVGNAALYNSNADSNIGIGERAGYGFSNSNNIALGSSAGDGYQGASLVALGYQAGYTNTIASKIVAIGEQAAIGSSGEECNFIGYQAGQNNTGNSCNGIGYASLHNNIADGCSAIGFAAGESNEGDYLVAIGQSAGNAQDGTNVIAIGYNAGASNGYSNVCLLGENASATIAGQHTFSNGTYQWRTNTIGLTQDVERNLIDQPTGKEIVTVLDSNALGQVANYDFTYTPLPRAGKYRVCPYLSIRSTSVSPNLTVKLDFVDNNGDSQLITLYSNDGTSPFTTSGTFLFSPVDILVDGTANIILQFIYGSGTITYDASCTIQAIN